MAVRLERAWVGQDSGEEEEEERMVYRAVERKPWSRCILTFDA
jgi:hypothetical protein